MVKRAVKARVSENDAKKLPAKKRFSIPSFRLRSSCAGVFGVKEVLPLESSSSSNSSQAVPCRRGKLKVGCVGELDLDDGVPFVWDTRVSGEAIPMLFSIDCGVWKLNF